MKTQHYNTYSGGCSCCSNDMYISMFETGTNTFHTSRKKGAHTSQIFVFLLHAFGECVVFLRYFVAEKAIPFTFISSMSILILIVLMLCCAVCVGSSSVSMLRKRQATMPSTHIYITSTPTQTRAGTRTIHLIIK